MSDLFKGRYRVESNRAKWWNYEDNASYFVTICAQHKQDFFGEIINEEMNLSLVGKIAQRNIELIPQFKSFAHVHEHVVMPDHVHIVIEIRNEANRNKSVNISRGFRLHAESLGAVIRGYKASVTSMAVKIDDDFRWQRGYNDRIIRNQNEYDGIVEYIRLNPLKHLERDRV